MTELRNRSIRKFNPGTLQTDEEVIEQFVVRKHELDIVLDVLRGNVESSSCQHVLVVAPRGRGKTMLLARVAAELRADDKLSERLLPVRFMEESQEIFNLTDFWLETLFHLARESATHDPEFARALLETHEDLTGRWREQSLEGHARATVLDAADRLGKKLVLMVENLQSLRDNADVDFGWQLRKVLQVDPQIILLATATSRFEGLDDVTQPFFELFRMVDLQRLSTEECRRLWQVVSGDEVSGREIRPLEILTGGNPRLLVIIAGFSQHRSLRQLMEELVKLIDEHTEYFRSQLEVLARTERRVYVAVIDLWRASSTGEVAARARMDVRTVSTLLGRLVNRGVVLMEGSGKKRLYAAERLYSIYYKLRRERNETAVVENLIRFMITFYSEAELAEMSGMLMAEAAQSKVIREGIDRATAELPNVGNMFAGIAPPGIEGPSNQLTTIDNERFKRLGEEVEAALDAETFEKVIEIVDQFFASQSANCSHVPEPRIAAVSLAKALAHERLDEFEAAIAAYDKVVEWCGVLDTPEVQGLVANALVNKGVARGQLGEFEAALAACEEVIARFGTS
ncbi:MAG: ATP-binding protein, partial [Nitrospira sp. SB0672_bin_25]|nr:ATP-binding protein [Nitrospira sp. SB0672_bin_25]